jgi:hypothetical protein
MAIVKRKPRAANQTTFRHVWLAGLGLVAVTRRQAVAAPARLAAQAEAAQRRMQELVGNAGAGVREQVEPRVVRFSAEVEARLAPVLDKLGLKPHGRRSARNARKTTGKSQARRVARTPAKRAARKG